MDIHLLLSMEYVCTAKLLTNTLQTQTKKYDFPIGIKIEMLLKKARHIIYRI